MTLDAHTRRRLERTIARLEQQVAQLQSERDAAYDGMAAAIHTLKIILAERDAAHALLKKLGWGPVGQPRRRR